VRELRLHELTVIDKASTTEGVGMVRPTLEKKG
jgi:hypothetical protein